MDEKSNLLSISKKDRPFLNTALWLFLIFTLALSVRLVRYSLDSRIEKDGVLYVNMAKDWNNLGVEKAFDRNPRIPPFYIFLLMMGEKVGFGAENAGVFISILAGSLTALSVYLLAIVFLEKKLALIAAFLASLHPIFIRLSPEVLRDSLFIFCYVSSLAFFVNGIKSKKIYYWFPAGFFAALAAMTRSEGAELILVPFAWLAVEFLFEYLNNKKNSDGGSLIKPMTTALKSVVKKYLPGIICAIAIFSLCSFPVQIALEETSCSWTVFDHRIVGYIERLLMKL